VFVLTAEGTNLNYQEEAVVLVSTSREKILKIYNQRRGDAQHNRYWYKVRECQDGKDISFDDSTLICSENPLDQKILKNR